MLINGRGESAVMSDERLLVTRPLDAEMDIPTANIDLIAEDKHWQEPVPIISTESFEDRQHRRQRHVVLSDYHIRTYRERVWDVARECYTTQIATAHDPLAMAAAEAFIEEWEPDVIWFNGDFIDAHQVSKFCKSPRDMDGLQEDLDLLHELFKRFAKKWPRAEKHYLLGNHEARFQNYINMQAPALAGLRALSDYSIFGSKSGDMQVYPYPQRIPIIPGVLDICHGDKVAGKSGATAQKMLDKGTSGVSGHVHRLGMAYRTDRTGTKVWAEGGCLCDLNPTYVQDPDWQAGITLIYVDQKEGRFTMEQAPIIKGKAYHAGRIYQAA